jgi:hypothetical protein
LAALPGCRPSFEARTQHSCHHTQSSGWWLIMRLKLTCTSAAGGGTGPELRA